MKTTTLYTTITIVIFLCSCKQEKMNSFTSETFNIEIDQSGFITSLLNIESNRNYLPDEYRSPVMAVVDNGQLSMPESFTILENTLYQLNFDQAQTRVILKIEPKPTHISFRVEDTLDDDSLEAIIWGPYAVEIGDIIGENIGVVRNKDFAIGIQSLNPRTTAGKLDNIRGVTSYHGTAAEAMDFGSILQAFAINRTKDRTKSKWDGWEEKQPGRPIDILNDEEGLINGSAIALFGCKPENALKTIGAIEVAEGLPHPEIDGVWVKESKETGRAYVISPFTEDDVDIMIEYTKKAGLRSLYHEEPFKTWGNFELDEKSFPSGIEGLKTCAEKARKQGLNLGVHTLTNFITPNDKFVTPIPDRRLVFTGSASLNNDINASDFDIEVSDNQMILNQKNSKLNTVRIGDELIRYGSVSEEKPFVLYDCQRGAWGTEASAHAKGDEVVKLLDFAYRTFYPNWEMQKDMVRNISDLINEAGVTQMGFDGHEGCFATGNGDYAMDKYALDWYNMVDHVTVNSSSRLKHFYWHINHFINWGEPWYGGFRESQADRRFKVQPFLERNYLKNMLGWFMIKSTTIPTDIEWMMARAAGYDAGFAMVLRRPELEGNPYTDELLDLIRTWEEARLSGAFSDEQRERLKEGNNEFHLEKVGEKAWVLHPFTTSSFEHQKKVLQPGEPTDSDWAFSNRGDEQPLQFRLTLKGKDGAITKPDLEFDHSFKFNLPDKIEAGYSITCNGSRKLRIYDVKGRFVKTYDMGREPPLLRKGTHNIRFDCTFSGSDDLIMNIIIKKEGEEEKISL